MVTRPEVVLARGARHGGHECPAVGESQEGPGFVDDQQPRSTIAADAGPDPAGDQVNGQWTQLIFELLDVEDDQASVQLDVGWTRNESGAERAGDVAFEADGQTGCRLAGQLAEDRMQVFEKGCRTSVRGDVGGDPGARVGAVHRPVEDGTQVVIEGSGRSARRVGAAQHDVE